MGYLRLEGKRLYRQELVDKPAVGLTLERPRCSNQVITRFQMRESHIGHARLVPDLRPCHVQQAQVTILLVAIDEAIQARGVSGRELRSFQTGQAPPPRCTMASVGLLGQRPVSRFRSGMLTQRFMGVARQQARPRIRVGINSVDCLKRCLRPPC